MATSRLTREKHGALLGGVCAGFAATYHLDVALVRVIMVTLTLVTGGLGACFYLAAWLVMPGPGQGSAPAAELARANVDDIVATARQRARDLRRASVRDTAAMARAVMERAARAASDAVRGPRGAFGGAAAPATSAAGATSIATWTPPPSNPRARHGGFKPPRATPPRERI